jgi:NADPH:quinone reductase-like Zn-dependent oxidoreductase
MARAGVAAVPRPGPGEVGVDVEALAVGLLDVDWATEAQRRPEGRMFSGNLALLPR